MLRAGAEEHDKLMAYALSLTHLVNAAFVSTLAEGIGVERFEGVAPPLGATRLDLGKAVLSQDPSLLSQTQTDDPLVSGVLSPVIAELQRLARAVTKEDVAGLEEKSASLAGEFPRGELERALRGVYPVADVAPVSRGGFRLGKKDLKRLENAGPRPVPTPHGGHDGGYGNRG